ncbi:hypothetical protein LLEC1_06483 [Akanthomyces lecanii]|uniref:Uncharacterized protein n=1 Tax=Cordyceps confragosa TaxID=2714763 RepID=A0A179IEV1_CORDF|nr:hypothetical protein LLEC1_06483 [Akanthomyces lecanii]
MADNTPNSSTADDGLNSPITPALNQHIRRKPISSSQFNNLPIQQASLAHDASSISDTSSNRPYNAVGGEDTLDDEAASGSILKSSKYSSWPQPLAMWKWETVSLSTAFVAFVSIIVLLRVYEDKDLEEWKVPLSINAIVASLTAILKGSLGLPVANGISQLKWVWFMSKTRNLIDMDTYDKASRGTWGSVLFLATFLSKLQLSPLAAFGALLTLLTLLIDPFSQASVFVDSCTHKVYIHNLIPLTANYSISGGRPGAGYQYLDSGMEIAINVGLGQPPANSSDSIKSFVGCPTGNCTVSVSETGIFSTLTMCHKCLDVSNDIERHNLTFTTPPDGVGTYTKPAVYDNYTYQYGNRSSPSVFHQLIVGTGSSGPWKDNTTSAVPGFPLPFNITASSPWTTSNNAAQYRGRLWPEKNESKNTAIASLQGIGLVLDTQCNQLLSQCESHVLAFDCALQPCIKAFNASVSSGVYREDEIDRWYLHKSNEISAYEAALNQTYINGTLRDCAPSNRPSPSHPMAISNGAEYNFDKTYLWYPAECYHYMLQTSVMGIAQYLVPLVQKAQIGQDSSVVGDAWLKQFWNDGKLDMDRVETLLNGLALSMGAQMRKMSGRTGYLNGRIYNDTTHVPGYSVALRPCIRVRWKFLSYPATLLMAELAFFVAVVIMNWRSSWTGEWKSSSLPLILHNGRVQTMGEKDLREEAGHFQGRLMQEHDGDGRWRLLKSEGRRRNSVP